MAFTIRGISRRGGKEFPCEEIRDKTTIFEVKKQLTLSKNAWFSINQITIVFRKNFILKVAENTDNIYDCLIDKFNPYFTFCISQEPTYRDFKVVMKYQSKSYFCYISPEDYVSTIKKLIIEKYHLKKQKINFSYDYDENILIKNSKISPLNNIFIMSIA
jgi:hypothetical protein